MFVNCVRSLKTLRALGLRSKSSIPKLGHVHGYGFHLSHGVSGDSRPHGFICNAKRSKKREASTKMPPAPPQKKAEPWTEVDVVMLLLLLVESYSRQMEKPLLEDAEIVNIANDVFHAPFCILVHDYVGQDDVKYMYANKAALSMMSADWVDIVNQPSTSFERSVLDDVLSKGQLSGLSVPWKTADGNQVELQDVCIVNVCSPSDEVVGQAIFFDKWLLEDGTEAGPGYVPSDRIPTETEIAAAQQEVDDIASRIRDMKEKQGLTNSDPVVKDAVNKLLEAKERLMKLNELVGTSVDSSKETENEA